jgi:hypothetical protein
VTRRFGPVFLQNVLKVNMPHPSLQSLNASCALASAFLVQQLSHSTPYHRLSSNSRRFRYQTQPTAAVIMVCAKCQKLNKTTLATPGVKKKSEMYYGSAASSSGDKKSATLGQNGISKVRPAVYSYFYSIR